MISVIATVTTKPAMRDAFLLVFHELMLEVQAEDGCIDYFPTVDVVSGIEMQGEVREQVVTILEKWETLDSLQTHLKAAHMVAFRDRVADLVDSVTLQVLQPA